ncbi:MAG: hypothetical protein J7493_09385 [Porphyrobacter sp.]|nr:hypothetical protein [Porphyrobacter sp.]
MKPANRRDAWTIAALAACGIALGAVTAPLFAPLPKVPVAEPVQFSGRPQAASYGEQPVWVDPGSQDLGIQGYVPSDAYDGPIWQYPAPAYEPWEPETTAAREEAQLVDSNAWQAADEAEAAAKDAAAAAAAAAAAPQPETVWKSDLANGLY